MSNVNYDKLYQRYKELYAEAEAKQQRLGLPMARPQFNSVKEFKHYYNVTQHDVKMQKLEGKLSRNTVVDVTAKLVKRQRYEVGYKKAQAFQVAELQAGKRPTKLRDIMQGRANWDFVKERYHELRSQGYSAKAASATIGEMFYIEA